MSVNIRVKLSLHSLATGSAATDIQCITPLCIWSGGLQGPRECKGNGEAFLHWPWPIILAACCIFNDGEECMYACTCMYERFFGTPSLEEIVENGRSSAKGKKSTLHIQDRYPCGSGNRYLFQLLWGWTSRVLSLSLLI